MLLVWELPGSFKLKLRLTNACSRTCKPLRALQAADARRYVAYKIGDIRKVNGAKISEILGLVRNIGKTLYCEC